MTTTKMNATLTRPEYLGAFLQEERRLVLVGIDEENPWEAFRSMRRAMRNERNASSVSVDIYAANAPIGQGADVISLESRRRAG